MDKARALQKSLLYPPRWVVIAVPPLSFAALILLFAANDTRSMPAYLIYGMSAYSLTIWLAAIPGLTSRIKFAIMKNRLFRETATAKVTGQYLHDPAFRGSVSIYQGMSVVNLVKFRRLGSPILSAAKVLNFIAALMSIRGLQTAMIAQFSGDAEQSRRMMNTMTGSAVYAIVIAIAICMLIRSKKSGKQVEAVE